jgi:hypothetical protein
VITTADVVAMYGAVLATIIAIIQWRQWLKSRQTLVIIANREFSEIPKHLSVTITNNEHVNVNVEYVGVGYGYRAWLTPWSRRHHESISMKAVEGDHPTGKGAGGLLKPGELMETYSDGEDFALFARPGLQLGFGARVCVWVDHSKADKSVCKVVG